MPNVVGTSIDIGSGPHLEILKSAGFGFREVSRSIDLRKNDQLISALTAADAVIAGAEPYPQNVIEALPKLRVIARSGVGFDAIDLAACDRAGIAVLTTPGVNHHSVAEHTLALLFGVARDFPHGRPPRPRRKVEADQRPPRDGFDDRHRRPGADRPGRRDPRDRRRS